MKHSITKTLLAITLLALTLTAADFFVPESHPDFLEIDSHYQSLTELTTQVHVLENKTITQNDVRDEALSIKDQYFRFMLNDNRIDKESIITYYNTVKKMYEMKIKYFTSLMGALDGDTRAEAFIFSKSAKHDLSIVVSLIDGYTDSGIGNIEHSETIKLVVNDIKIDSGVDEMDMSNPFENSIMKTETIDR